MRFEHRDGRERDAGIDMTPMMDIVFIMLIFFVLTASFTQTQTLDVERPSTASRLLIEVIDQIRLGGVANVAVATNAGHS